MAASEGSEEQTLVPKQCVLHVGPYEKRGQTEVKPFTAKIWAAAQTAAKIRQMKRNFRNSIYHEVVTNLPEEPKECDGFHFQCYRKFTAVKAEHDEKETTFQETPHLRSASGNRKSSPSTSGIFPTECLFCGYNRKRKKKSREPLGSCETLEAAESIQNAAKIHQDKYILSKISGTDLIAKEAKYHHSCKSAFLLRAKRFSSDSTETDSSQVQMKSTKTSVALTNLHEYIEKSIINAQRPELLGSLYDHYIDFCTAYDEERMEKFSLKRNLSNRFGDEIRIHTPKGRKIGALVYSACAVDTSVRMAYDYSSSDERTISKAALILRRHCLDAQRERIKINATLNDLTEGDISTPDILTNFFRIFYSGDISDGPKGKRLERRVLASSQDALFIVHRGRARPAKHVTLGMAIKSSTGSKNLVNIFNRLGYCLNYSALEELETATAEAHLARNKACPEGTIEGLTMGLAFDNFDELTQTLSGADTLHDTMGILYQNIPQQPDIDISVPSESLREESKEATTKGTTCQPQENTKKRKRTLDVHNSSVIPYHGKAKMTVFQYKCTDVFSLQNNLMARRLDFLWIMQHTLSSHDVPMWTGFNAKICDDVLPTQKVHYMPNLKEPITSLSVIYNTLVITKRCAEECDQRYGIVTYDLNAAKPAMQIQVTEAPTFNNVFIMLGAFHIEMAYFKAIGKLIVESGGPSVLTDANVLASGSLNGFITGKHFNRCKRLHPLLALAFEVLHFKEFLKAFDEKDEIRNLINDLELVNTTEKVLTDTFGKAIFQRCESAYAEYTNLTRTGAHGPTARFWMNYIDHIRMYHTLERAIRTNNIELFTSYLTPIINLFFATNHVNYARWLTKYQLDLLNIDYTHPGLRNLLEQGAFTVRRSSHPFSRSPVDLTLEQTVNAHAASRLTGITSFTNSYSARLRWMITKPIRALFIHQLQDMVGLGHKEAAVVELQPKRVERDNRDLRKIVKQIETTSNPFSNNELPHSLYNICTGRAVSDDIKDSLLSVPNISKTIHNQFIEECIRDPKRFESPIKRLKMKTFVDAGANNRRTRDLKIASLKCTRDLMGRLLVLALKTELDLQYVLQFPLTPVPLTMSSPDETIARTDKSKLLHHLENTITSEDTPTKPESIDCCIIDGHFLLHALPPNLPPTYGELARTIPTYTVQSPASEIHLVFDDYVTPSLKDVERTRRQRTERLFSINGPNQKRIPRDINEALKSRSFKKQLPIFLATEWQNDSYKEILGNRHLYLDGPQACYHFSTKDGEMKREFIESLTSNHQEADTKIILHAQAADGPDKSIIVRASDTDIAVILIYHSERLHGNLWMDCGTGNKRRFVNISAIAKKIGFSVSRSLPGFHAFTGSDFTSAFVNKGKTSPYDKMVKFSDVQTAFANMTRGRLSADDQATLLRFTALLYGAKDDVSLNEMRYRKFLNSYGPKMHGKNPLSRIKGVDASSIPPCEAEMKPHISRAAFVAKMWADADHLTLNQFPDIDNGWELVNGVYEPIWFEGPQLPEVLVDESKKKRDEDDTDEEMSQSSSDSDVCSSDEED